MSNVTVQEALKSIELAEETGSTQYLLDALNDCKTALSEIEKCEPVAEYKTYTGVGGICAPFNRFEFKPDFVNNAKIGDKLYAEPQNNKDTSRLNWLQTNFDSALTRENIDIAMQGNVNHTSPQPIECEDWQYFDKAYKKAAETSDATDWMNAALLAQQVRRKQLNTKG